LTRSETTARLLFTLPNVAFKFRNNFILKRNDFGLLALYIQVDTAIDEVSNKASDLEAFSHGHGLIAKADPLNVSLEPAIQLKNVIIHDW
jgi:hypothetical protein